MSRHVPGPEEQAALPFLQGGGALGALMRAHDWDGTALGLPAGWPAPLRTIVGVMLNSTFPMFVTWGPAQSLLYNDAYAEILGVKHPRALCRPLHEVWAEVWIEVAPLVGRALGGASVFSDSLPLVTRRSGFDEQTWFAFSYCPLRDEQGVVRGIFCVCMDTTGQVRAERERMEENERLRALFDQAPGFMCVLSGPLHVYELANAAYLETVGRRDILGKTVREALPDIGGQGFYELLDAVYASGKPYLANAAEVQFSPRPEGPPETLYLNFVYQPIRDNRGTVTGIFVEGTDVTNRVRAEQALRQLNDTLEQRIAEAITERESMQDELRQAQKMEAVGQLTGGIAHDFNNLLQGITGSLDLVQRRLAQGRSGELDRFISNAMGSANRAAALTHRLLAFSRRQPLDPRPVQINQLVTSVEELLRRTMGERIEIELGMAASLWLTVCDPNQLENALLNLAINARDAMPGGGRLSIETSNVVLGPEEGGSDLFVPGEYVCLAVADSGIGMTREVMERAFEPFFTTKPPGKGTGLGLSMIYGFARQSGGYARIESRPGEGTKIRLYLPRCTGAREAAEGGGAAATEMPAPCTGTVLVVEDDSVVRHLIVEILGELGHPVLEAGDGRSGLTILRSDTRVDLLVADIGLPGISGIELADAGIVLRPGLKVLLMTGHAEVSNLPPALTATGVQLIDKPFLMDAFAASVRALL